MSSPATTPAGGPGKFLKNVLGIIFFIVLIIGGILIAVYGARTIPGLFSNGNGASVYSSSIFHPNASSTTGTTNTTATTNTTSAPTQTTTGTTNTTSSVGTILKNGLSTPILPKAPAIKDPNTTTTSGGTTQTTTRTSTGGHYVVVPSSYYGLSDLTVHITEVGYLNSNDQFIESDVVPANKIGVVHFVIFNGGTNMSGSWRLEATLPTDQKYESGYQASIAPGQSSVGELNFDNADRGNNQDIVVIVDSNNNVQESNERNNRASAQIDIR